MNTNTKPCIITLCVSMFTACTERVIPLDSVTADISCSGHPVPLMKQGSALRLIYVQALPWFSNGMVRQLLLTADWPCNTCDGAHSSDSSPVFTTVSYSVISWGTQQPRQGEYIIRYLAFVGGFTSNTVLHWLSNKVRFFLQ